MHFFEALGSQEFQVPLLEELEGSFLVVQLI